MSTDGMADVEVPVNGTVIVENTDVYEIESEKNAFVMCTCRDDKHGEYARTHNLSPGVPPHVVGVKTVKMVWVPNTPTRPEVDIQVEW